MLDRRDRALFRDIAQTYEYVHFGDFAKWVFDEKLPMSPRLKKTKSGTLSEWLEVIRRERADWSSITVRTVADMEKRERGLKELNDEEEAVTKVWEEGGLDNRDDSHAALVGNPKLTISAEVQCQRWLGKLMHGDSAPDKPKREYLKEARKAFPGLSDRGFLRAWGNAVTSSGNARCRKPGRKS